MNEYIVCIKDGKIRGRSAVDYRGNTYYSFQGIPYARPPVGDLRFKAPLPPNPWKGIRDATKEGKNSLQLEYEVTGSEDCLYLNVYTPQLAKQENATMRPVFFWIHGGKFLNGSGDSNIFGPDYLMTQNVVLVTINYRLGILGFFNLDDPSLEVTGNAGLKDIVMALKWVRENISTFCGDENNITVGGASSGSASVHYLMLSPMSKGLFHRVVMHSGSALSPWALTKSNPQVIAKALGCNSAIEKDILKYLRSVPAEKILDAQKKLNVDHYIHKLRLVAPVVENCSPKFAFITKHPMDIIKSGDYYKVPMLIGYCSKEGNFQEMVYKDINVEAFCDFQTKIPFFFNIPYGSEYSKKVGKQIEKYYYGNSTKEKTNFEKLSLLNSDAIFLHGIFTSIEHQLRNLNAPIYLFKLCLNTPLNHSKALFGIKHPGPMHGDEISYLFSNNFIKISNKQEETNVFRMVKLWTNFMRNGDPNPKDNDSSVINSKWDPVKPGRCNYLDIDTSLSTGLNLDFERMEFWNNIALNNPYESKY